MEGTVSEGIARGGGRGRKPSGEGVGRKRWQGKRAGGLPSF